MTVGRAGARTSTLTSSPSSRRGCGRRTTAASRRACSGCSSRRIREQAHVSWPRALAASLLLTRAAAGFARSTGDYERFAPDIARGYRILGLPDARRRRGGRPPRASLVGRPAGDRPGGRRRRPATAITRPVRGALRGARASAWRKPAGCAAWPPRSATAARPTIRTGPTGPGTAYWPEVARLLRESYRSLHAGARGRATLSRPPRRLSPSARPVAGRRPTTRPGRRAAARSSLTRVPDEERRQAVGDRRPPGRSAGDGHQPRHADG